MILYRPTTREYITCPECGLPHGVIEDGQVVILSRHHGRTHRLCLSPVELREMAERIEKTDRTRGGPTGGQYNER